MNASVKIPKPILYARDFCVYDELAGKGSPVSRKSGALLRHAVGKIGVSVMLRENFASTVRHVEVVVIACVCVLRSIVASHAMYGTPLSLNSMYRVVRRQTSAHGHVCKLSERMKPRRHNVDH